jgi:N-acetylmuramoyl-L-alanine amidase
MPPEIVACHDQGGALIDHLASQLYELAGEQEVRVIEALAAAFANRWRLRLDEPPRGLCEPVSAAGFERGAVPEVAGRLAICRRVARRALRGSLLDPTRGATAWHRIEASPAWSRNLLPIGMFGPFLFYRLSPLQHPEQQWPQIASVGHREQASVD